MTLPVAAGLVLAGLALLAAGGELLVRGATTLARLAGLTPAVIGLTVVAMGTSLPELTVSVVASLDGRPDIAVGNVVGSNIANLGLILGLSALIAPLPIRGSVVKLEWPVMFLVSLAFWLAGRDGVVDRSEATVQLMALVAFVAYVVYLARREVTFDQSRALAAEVEQLTLRTRLQRTALSIVVVAVGIGLLVAGGSWLVRGSVRLAELAGLSERIIGLTIVAVGTSAPELATSIVAAVRRHSDIAIANLIGSNIFNLLGIIGAAGVIAPLTVSAAIRASDVWWMIGTAALLLPLMLLRMRLGRIDGSILLGVYGAYLVLLLR